MLSDAVADADEQRLLFYWAEDSESLSRQCLGRNRPFAMGAFVRAAGERESDSNLSDVAEVLRATKSASCPLTCCCLCTCGALPVRLTSFSRPRRPHPRSLLRAQEVEVRDLCGRHMARVVRNGGFFKNEFSIYDWQVGGLRLLALRSKHQWSPTSAQCPTPHASKSHLQSFVLLISPQDTEALRIVGPQCFEEEIVDFQVPLSSPPPPPHALRAHRARLSCSLQLYAARAGGETGPADANAREGAGRHRPVGGRGGLRAQAVGRPRAGVAHRRRQCALPSPPLTTPHWPILAPVPIPILIPFAFTRNRSMQFGREG